MIPLRPHKVILRQAIARSGPHLYSLRNSRSPKRTKESNMDENPWYRDGLRFTCTQCGDCCSGPSGFVWVTEEEIRQIADYLGVRLGEMQINHLRYVGARTSLREFPNGDCTFLDGQTRKCTVYPVRPAQCRTWPFWGSNLATPESWQETVSVCPGAGCGQLHSLEQITNIKDVVDI